MSLGLGISLQKQSGLYVFTTEAKTLFAAFSGTYTTARKIAIDKMIRDLKNAGVWGKLDVLQMYAAPTVADAVVNWKNPGTYNATLVNSPTLEVDRGITGDGVSSYISSGFIPSNGVNYLKDSAGVHIAIRSDIDGVKTDIGVYDGTNYVNFISRYASTQSIYMLNQTNSTSTTSITSSIGFFSVLRTASNAIERRRNKTSTATNTTASTNRPTKVIYIGAQNGNGTPSNYSNRQYAIFAASAGLSETENNALTDVLETYLDYVGAGVI